MELAERQSGVVGRRQLEAIGFTGGGISRWIAEGRLHRIHPGVFALGHRCLSTEGELAAALLYAGPDAALSHMTAAWWLGMLPVTPRRLHVCVPHRRRSLAGVRVHCRRDLERHRHKRFAVTAPARTLLDVAAVLRFGELRRALAEAEYLRLVTLDDIEAVLGRGRPGSAALRAALDRHRPELARVRSRLEEEFVLLCERYALPPPDVNAKVAGWMVDAVWFAARVVVELDSRLAHGTPAAMEQDRRRDLDLRAAGYTVMRYTWRQLADEPERIVADLRRHGIGAPRPIT